MDSVNDLKPISRSSKSLMMSTKFFNERPRRSNRQTTSVSPGRNDLSVASQVRVDVVWHPTWFLGRWFGTQLE